MKTQNHIYQLFRNLHLFGSIFCAISFLIATGTSALAQSSGQTRPFHAVVVSIESTDIPNVIAPGWPAWESISAAKATHLGKTSGYGVNYSFGYGGWWTGDEIGFHLVGVAVMTMVAANGDELEITTDWRYYIPAFQPPGSPYADVVLGDWEITGGTGRFENATGAGTSEGRNNEDGDRVHVYDGQINY
jgi:hypothetical protein